jgi:two-component sensor histidine kinase
MLEVCDDGSGFPPGFDPAKSANLGLNLIEQMSRWDLRGQTKYFNHEGGGCVHVTFPLPKQQKVVA